MLTRSLIRSEQKEGEVNGMLDMCCHSNSFVIDVQLGGATKTSKAAAMATTSQQQQQRYQQYHIG